MNAHQKAQDAIRDRLIKRGREELKGRRKPLAFTGVPDADVLLNDIVRYPHAFVIGCVMDRQMKAERAWLIPHLVSKKVGGFEFDQLAGLSQNKVLTLLTKPKPLHRFAEVMSRHFHSALQRIREQYGGDARGIWEGRPSSAAVVYRFLEFDGVGPKIATMATNLLARQFKVPFRDYHSVDVSADVHVRRVFARLGLTPADATVESVVYRARDLHPQFPGLFDLPAWELGHEWCRAGKPLCGDCYMRDICPTAANSQW